MTRILAVDPGDVRIGLAISDPTATIARPLEVILHTSRQKDAKNILSYAAEYEVGSILVGIPYNEESHQARKALRLVEALEEISSIPILTWDESGSTQIARSHQRIDIPIDAHAAAVILQEYLDAKST
jgi:putative Holliday junction resolvase